MMADEYWQQHCKRLGDYLHGQRELANFSLRELAERAHISNPYLSQIEHGRHLPSVKILQALALALDVSARTVLAEVGLLEPGPAPGRERNVSVAIRGDPRLAAGEKDALLAVYASYLS